jgi:hypothetical protein
MDSNKVHASCWTIAWHWLVLLGVAAALVACGGGSSADQVNPSLLQAPSADTSCSFNHIYITVEKIRVRQGAAGPDDEKGWTDITLPAPRRIDLINLSGGLLQEVGAAPLPAGHYSDIRLVLASNGTTGTATLANAVQLSGGDLTLAPLSTPVGQGGLKLQVDFDVAAGQFADLVLAEFDPCQSIVRAGNSGRFVLKPEIAARAVLVPANQERRFDGSISPLFGGGFVVLRRDFATNVVIAQRFDASGAPVGPEVRIAVNVATGGSFVGITPLAGGGYVATLLGPTPNPEQRFVADFPVIIQRFAADGTLLGSEQVAVSQPFALRFVPTALPQTAALPGGGYVVVWGQQDPNGFNVYVQRFAADGTAAGAAQLVGAGGGELHVVAMASGGYLVVSGVNPIFARAFGPNDAALGPAQPVGVRPLFGVDLRVAVAALTGGGAVVAWSNDVGGLFVFARRLAADGTPIGDAVRVDGSTPLEPGISPQSEPSVAALTDGGYVITWLGNGVIYGRRFAADGTPLGPVTRINTAPTNFPGGTVTAIGTGFVVTWSSGGAGEGFARFFDASGLIGGT